MLTSLILLIAHAMVWGAAIRWALGVLHREVRGIW
jgi:hypothetical protein